jgi:hypothetical protein
MYMSNRKIKKTKDSIKEKIIEEDLIKHIVEVMNFQNIRDSKGLVFLKTGHVIKVKNFFSSVLGMWQSFNRAIANDDKETLIKLDNGVISNGEISINLEEVAAMMAHPSSNNFKIIDYKEYMKDIKPLE